MFENKLQALVSKNVFFFELKKKKHEGPLFSSGTILKIKLYTCLATYVGCEELTAVVELHFCVVGVQASFFL